MKNQEVAYSSEKYVSRIIFRGGLDLCILGIIAYKLFTIPIPEDTNPCVVIVVVIIWLFYAIFTYLQYQCTRKCKMHDSSVSIRFEYDNRRIIYCRDGEEQTIPYEEITDFVWVYGWGYGVWMDYVVICLASGQKIAISDLVDDFHESFRDDPALKAIHRRRKLTILPNIEDKSQYS